MLSNIKSNSGSAKKNSFLTEMSNLVFFWFVGVIYFTLFRFIFILLNSADINSKLTISNYIDGFFMGFRYDIIVIAKFLILPFVSIYLLIPFKKVGISIKLRKVFQVLFSITSVLITVITINYYDEYKNQFNHFLFMVLYDDKKAVLQTILSDFNPIINLFIIVFSIISLLKIFNHFEEKDKIYRFLNSFNFKYRNPFFKILLLILFVGGFRASFTGYPVRRHYNAVTPDNFINKTIINPFKALEYAFLDYNKTNNIYTKKNPFGEIPSSIKSKYVSINNCLKKETKALLLPQKKPNQIFLIVMESYDYWSLMDKYLDLKLTPELKNIENEGVSFTNFLPASYSTFNSLGGIVTSIPYTGVNISKIGEVRSFKTSIFTQFKQLGYETNFFSGGFLSWENLQNFIKKQGADNLYGAPDSNEEKVIWGVIDEYLFDLVLKKVDPKKKSLNIILSTSHHSPYEVDVYKKGFIYKTKKELPLKYQEIYNQKNTTLKQLGHLWYSDKSLGDFVKKAKEKYPNSLFAITGDHFGRKFINTNPTLYENSVVPFILYGDYVKGFPKKIETPGSHKDISSTLLDIIAPDNFSYYSFGNSLLRDDDTKIGYAFEKIISKNEIKQYTNDYDIISFAIDTTIVRKKVNYKQKLDSLMSLAWHYTLKGDTIK